MDHRLQIILAAKDLTGNAFTKFKGTVAAMTKSIFSLRGAITTLAGAGGVGYLVKSSLDAADVIGKTAAKLGISTSALQEFQYAANLSGVSTETLNMALQRFTRRTAEAAQGKGELKGVLEQYNVAVIDAAGNTRKFVDVLNDLADVMARTDSGSERLRIAFKAFDSEGAALVNMLKNGSAAMDFTRKKARDLGLVISDSLIANAADAKDNLHTLGTVLKTQVTGAILELAPEITKVSASVLSWIQENEKLISQNIQGTFETIAGAIAKVADAYKKLDAYYNAPVPENYLQAYREQLEATLEVQQKQLANIKRFGYEGGKAYEELSQKIALTKDHLHLVKDELIDRALLDYFDDLDQKSKAAANSVAKLATAAGSAGPAGADSLSGARWSPRPDRGQWAPRAGGMVGVVEAEKQLLSEMTEATEDAYDQMDAHVQAYYDNIEAQAQKTADGVTYLADTMSNAFTGFVTDGKFKFSDFADSIIADLIRIQSRTLLTNLFSSAAAGGAGGFFSFFSANAKGGAYDAGGFLPFEKGGIVNRPTVFPFAGGMGVMGEAGPEAILPLTRTRGGDLGVKAAGQNVKVEIINNTPSQIQTKQGREPDGSQLIQVVIDAVATDLKRGGRVAQATQQVYGLRRQGRIV